MCQIAKLNFFNSQVSLKCQIWHIWYFEMPIGSLPMQWWFHRLIKQRLHLLLHRTIGDYRTIGRSVWQTARLIVSAHMMFTTSHVIFIIIRIVNISTFIVRFWRINSSNSRHSPRAQLLFSTVGLLGRAPLQLSDYRRLSDFSSRTSLPEVRSDSPIAADSPIVADSPMR